MDRPRPVARSGFRERGFTVLVVTLAQFMAVASTSSVSVALPTIGRDLDASSTSLEWIVDSYVIVYASLLIAGGVLSDRMGRKGMFMAGVTLFGVGSLVAGVAPSIGLLLCGRVIQGLGPAIVTPTSLAIISATFDDPGERATAIGVWSSGSGLALALGPAIGGLLVDVIGWRSVFLLNVPLAALIVALGTRLIPRIQRTKGAAAFDWTGAFLTTLGVGLLTFGLIEGPDRGWGSSLIIGSFVLSAFGLAVFVWWESRNRAPLIDVSLFRRAPFTVANLAGLAVFFAFIGAIVYLSAYFQQVQGRSALGAGLAVLPIGLGFFVSAQLSGRIVGRFGPRLPMVAGLCLCGVAMIGLVRLRISSPISASWWDLLAVGFGGGLCLTPMTATAMAAVRSERAGMASAIHNSMRQVGQALGVAVLGSLVYAGVTGARAGGGRLSGAPADAFVDGLHHAVLVSGGCLLVAALLASALIPRGLLGRA
ncbi:MAG TPA: MFS transporter [Solirubrobacteraceae bacterium]|nr:MFS transporter [Solirubrobacteraceae bacterium]